MKRIIALLLISICFISLFAEERNIELQENKAERGARSLSYIPTVTQDGNILYIYSDSPIEYLHISITDLLTGTTSYYNNITVLKGEFYRLELQNFDIGNYKIELNTDQKSYYGYFGVIYK